MSDIEQVKREVVTGNPSGDRWNLSFPSLRRYKSLSLVELWRELEPRAAEEIKKLSASLGISSDQLLSSMRDGKFKYSEFAKLSSELSAGRKKGLFPEQVYTEERYVQYQRLYYLLQSLPQHLREPPTQVPGWQAITRREFVNGGWCWTTEALRDEAGNLIAGRIIVDERGEIQTVERGTVLSRGNLRSRKPFLVEIDGVRYAIQFRNHRPLARPLEPKVPEPLLSLFDINRNGSLDDQLARVGNFGNKRAFFSVPFGAENNSRQLLELYRDYLHSVPAEQRPRREQDFFKRIDSLVQLGKTLSNAALGDSAEEASNLLGTTVENKNDANTDISVPRVRSYEDLSHPIIALLHSKAISHLQRLSGGRFPSLFLQPGRLNEQFVTPPDDEVALGLLISAANRALVAWRPEPSRSQRKKPLIEFHADPFVPSGVGSGKLLPQNGSGLGLLTHTEVDLRTVIRKAFPKQLQSSVSAETVSRDGGRVRYKAIFHNDVDLRALGQFRLHLDSHPGLGAEIQISRNQMGQTVLFLSWPETFLRYHGDLIQAEVSNFFPLGPTAFLAFDFRNRMNKELSTERIKLRSSEVMDELRSTIAEVDEFTREDAHSKQALTNATKRLFDLLCRGRNSKEDESSPGNPLLHLLHLRLEALQNFTLPFRNGHKPSQFSEVLMALHSLRVLAWEQNENLQRRHQLRKGTIVGLGIDFSAHGGSVILPQPLLRVQDEIKENYGRGRNQELVEIRGEILRTVEVRENQLQVKPSEGTTIELVGDRSVSLKPLAEGKFAIYSADASPVRIHERVTLLASGELRSQITLRQENTNTPELWSASIVPDGRGGIRVSPMDSNQAMEKMPTKIVQVSTVEVEGLERGDTYRISASSTPLNWAFEKIWRFLRIPGANKAPQGHRH